MKKGLTILALSLAVIAGGALAKDEPPQVDSNGLHLVEHSKLRLVYKLPDATFSQYDKVILVDCYVAFKKDWAQDRAFDAIRVTPEQIKTVKTRVATEFKKEFTKELEKRGYQVVPDTDAAKDVLIVRPAIINLDPQAPDPMGSIGDSSTFSDSAGSLTLFAELYDSVTSQMIAKVIDPEADQGFGGQMMRQSEATNKLALDRIVNKWANALADHMSHTAKD